VDLEVVADLVEVVVLAEEVLEDSVVEDSEAVVQEGVGKHCVCTK
jgi:hypothetical protein